MGAPRRPYNVCSGRAYKIRRLLDILLSLSRARVRVEVDPARLRPSDNPVILGSHARLTADTGNAVAHPSSFVALTYIGDDSFFVTGVEGLVDSP